MQLDFHYYATYCAACLAGYSGEESETIAWSAQFVDQCSETLLSKLKAPLSAATTMLSLEMLEARTDPVSLQEITRIWASFHFLPYDLYADVGKGSRRYREKYRLICNTNGELLKDTVDLAKGKSLQAAGIAMHVLADTWAHRYFAGTPSLVINNTDFYFFELDGEEDEEIEKRIVFKHSPSKPDDLESGLFMSSLYRGKENSIMNLGHGRAGHLPDYSFMRYKYLPAWGGYEEIIKDNPSDFYHAFCQMVYALKVLRDPEKDFETDRYDTESVAPYEERIKRILSIRQMDSCADWKALGEEISGKPLRDFQTEEYEAEYTAASGKEKDNTFFGRFFLAALSHKSMITNKIFKSGSRLAGFSVDFSEKGFRGIRDYRKLVRQAKEEQRV